MHIGEWRAALEFGAYVNAEIYARARSYTAALHEPYRSMMCRREQADA